MVRLAPTGQIRLDCVQRRVGRMLMGFARRCPSPAVLCELGWIPWSVLLVGERFGLCGRLLASPCSYIRWVIAASASSHGSWLAEFARSCAPWCGGVQPSSPGEWRKVRLKWLKDTTRVQAELRWAECQEHRALCHYKPAMWICNNRWEVNRFLNCAKVPAEIGRAHV